MARAAFGGGQNAGQAPMAEQVLAMRSWTRSRPFGVCRHLGLDSRREPSDSEQR